MMEYARAVDKLALWEFHTGGLVLTLMLLDGSQFCHCGLQDSYVSATHLLEFGEDTGL
jgi:hypothetical protein